VIRNRSALFRGRHFEEVIIILCVRWYLRYSPQLPRSGGDDGGARAVSGSHHHLALGPALCTLLNQRLRRELRHPNRSWRVDETYVRVAGKWTYLYRAVDSVGETIDFMLSPQRDLTAAKLFLRLALSATSGNGPRVITVDGHPAYSRAIAELKQSGELGRRCRPSPYLNNVIEQDHRFIRSALRPVFGFGRWKEPGERSTVTSRCI
jgi:IS6 family transposase